MTEIAQGLQELGCLDQFRVLNNQLLIAMDGTDVFSSEKICCQNCSTQQLKNGKILHRHTVITPVIVAPGQARVVPLPPEFVTPQDGSEKQDCEVNASKRWLLLHASDYAPWGCTILGDDLYCHQPFCEAILLQNMHFILTRKPLSHELLYEWVNESTIRYWMNRKSKHHLDAQTVAFLESPAGVRFLQRQMVAQHFVFGLMGGCGPSLHRYFLQLTGLHTFVACSNTTLRSLMRKLLDAVVTWGDQAKTDLTRLQ